MKKWRNPRSQKNKKTFWQKVKKFLFEPNKYKIEHGDTGLVRAYDDDDDDDDECLITCDSDDIRSSLNPYSVYGRNPDWCEMYEHRINVAQPGQTLKAVIDLDMRSMYFHVAVWYNTVQPQVNWLIASYAQSDNSDNWFRGVLMVNEESYDEVKEWFDQYIERVGNIDVPRILPDMVKGKTITGIPIESHGAVANKRLIAVPNIDMFDEWCWIVKNGTGKFRFFDRYFLIEDSTEACAFELSR